MHTLKAKRQLSVRAVLVCTLLSTIAQADTNRNFLAFAGSLLAPAYAHTEAVQEADSGCINIAAQPEFPIVTHGEVLFESPQGFWLAPSKYSYSLYGSSTASANWHFTQWLNPAQDFPAFASEESATPSDETSVISGRVIDRGGEWEIAQNGKNLPPGDEFAIFAEANRPKVYPGYRAAGKRSRPLSEMEYLHHTIGFMSKYEDVVAGEGITQGGFLTALVLENNENGHKFFYQLELRPVAKAPCDGWWEWSGPRWGYGDTILNYGKSIP
jgi:hypothetical protein